MVLLAFYGLMLLMLQRGWSVSSTAGYPVVVIGFTLPPMVT